MTEQLAALERYERWLRDNGVVFNTNMHPAIGKYGVGVLFEGKDDGDTSAKLVISAAERPRKREKKTIVAEIPQKLLIHPFYNVEVAALKEVVEEKAREFFEESLREKIDFDLIPIYWFLIKQKNDKTSKWFPYIDVLPKEYDTTIFWSEDELEELRGTPIFQGTHVHKQLLSQVLDMIHLFDKSVTKEDLYWAYTAVHSRDVGVNMEDNTENYVVPAPNPDTVIPCLIPLVDTFNHDSAVPVRFLTDNKNKVFRFEAEYDPSRGLEVYGNYGPKSNESLLFSYGFVLENNPNNTYWIQIGVKSGDFEKKQRLLKKEGLGTLHHIHQKAFPEDMIRAMRILCLNEEERFFYTNSLEMISIRNESQVLETLLTLIRERIVLLAEAIEANESADRPDSIRKRMAVQYRSEEMGILEFAQEFLSRNLREFRNRNFDISGSEPVVYSLHKKIADSEGLLAKAKEWTSQVSGGALEVVIHNGHIRVQKTSDDPSVIIAIDSDLIIGPETIAASESFAPLLEVLQAVELEVAEMIVVFMVHEMSNEDSQWKDFFAMFPETFDNCLYWEDESMEVIEDTWLGDIAKELRDKVSQLYYGKISRFCRSHSALFPRNIFSYEAVKRSYSIFLSCFEEFDSGGNEDGEEKDDMEVDKDGSNEPNNEKEENSGDGSSSGAPNHPEENLVPAVIPLPPIEFKPNSGARWQMAASEVGIVAAFTDSTSKELSHTYGGMFGLELLALQGLLSRHLVNSLPLRLTEDLGLSTIVIEMIKQNGIFGMGEDDRMVYWIKKGDTADSIVGDFVVALGVDISDAKGILASALASLQSMMTSQAQGENISPILILYFADMVEIIKDVVKRLTSGLRSID